MDIFKLTLDTKNINVKIARKNIKNIHLKVYRDLSVTLSVPNDVVDSYIVDYLSSKKYWIDKQLNMFEKNSGYNNIGNLKNGSSTQLLGKDLRILVNKGENGILLNDKTLTIFVNDVADINKINDIFENWWVEFAYSIYNQIIEKFMPIFSKYDIEKPKLEVKKMNTLWGSCSRKRNVITLNEFLLKANIRCIEYVVLHELTHLLYYGHNQDFYETLTIYMPDWKERKKELDTEVVQGL